MDNQWFYIKQWNQHSKERLVKHRTVRVSWSIDDGKEIETLPQFVKLPSTVKLTNKEINNYLSSTFGWPVKDWSVAYGKEH